MKNKIGWCDITWNSVWGCLNHCPYCYARKIAKRFAEQMNILEIRYKKKNKINNDNYIPAIIGDYREYINLRNFKPTFLYSQFEKKFPKKPQRIFVGSMSEIAHWEANWINKVIFKIFEYPQHIFQFLTKFPDTYSKWEFPQNCWLGVTVAGVCDLSDYHLKFYHRYIKKENIKFISLEPLLGRIPLDLLQFFNWVIIGAETGSQKGKVIPKKEWIEDIVNYCKDNKIPVYLKDSLKEIYLVEIKEFPAIEKEAKSDGS